MIVPSDWGMVGFEGTALSSLALNVLDHKAETESLHGSWRGTRSEKGCRIEVSHMMVELILSFGVFWVFWFSQCVYNIENEFTVRKEEDEVQLALQNVKAENVGYALKVRHSIPYHMKNVFQTILYRYPIDTIH